MNAKPRIAMFGSSLVSSYWNGAATYYRGIVRALAERGYRVTFFEPDAFERQQHRDMDPPRWAAVEVYDATEAGVERALGQAASADVLIKASGVGIFDELLERAVVDVAAKNGRISIFWDVDAPATLEQVDNGLKDGFRALVPRFDLVLTYGGGTPVVDAYSRLGAARCVPIYNALDARTHHPAAADGRFEGLLGLLANRLPDRERRIHDFFFQPASCLPGHNFVLGGSGWQENVPQLHNIRYVGHVGSKDHNAFNCSPTAVLNVSRKGMARYGFSPATRVFEAAGAAACLITDRWRGIELFLEPDREVLVADDGDQVVEHLQRLTPDRARRIGEAARQRILAEHTYGHRGRQVDELLGCATAASQG